jgi:hypothetical protein
MLKWFDNIQQFDKDLKDFELSESDDQFFCIFSTLYLT